MNTVSFSMYLVDSYIGSYNQTNASHFSITKPNASAVNTPTMNVAIPMFIKILDATLPTGSWPIFDFSRSAKSIIVSP